MTMHYLIIIHDTADLTITIAATPTVTLPTTISNTGTNLRLVRLLQVFL